jgi:hypothetical protein
VKYIKPELLPLSPALSLIQGMKTDITLNDGSPQMPHRGTTAGYESDE